MKHFLWITFIVSSAAFSDAYQHGSSLSGQIILKDISAANCPISDISSEIIAYLQETSDFLKPRGISSSVDKNGYFSFSVEDRYSNYNFFILRKDTNHILYQKVLYAYNAPKTYQMTVSCEHDMSHPGS